MVDCARECDALEHQGCVGFVYSLQRDTCYMRRLPPGTKTCAGATKPSAGYTVYGRDASCHFPAQPPAPPGPSPDTPTTPGLLPNVTLAPSRPVFVRVDLRPMDATSPVTFTLSWSAVAGQALAPVPASALSPSVSAPQHQRRLLQEAAATGLSLGGLARKAWGQCNHVPSKTAAFGNKESVS